MRHSDRMRTTIDLPEDIHELARRVARDRGVSLGEAIAALVRQNLGRTEGLRVGRSDRTGLPTVSVGRPVTSEDVRSLDDED